MTTAPKPSARQRSLRQLRNIGLIAAAVAVGLALFGIVSRYVSESRLSDKTTVEAVPTVAVIRPQRGVTNQELTLPGDVQAHFEAPIFARVPGYLKQWYEDIGAHVKGGQLLAEIDTPDLDQQLRQSRSCRGPGQPEARRADQPSLAGLDQNGFGLSAGRGREGWRRGSEAGRCRRGPGEREPAAGARGLQAHRGAL